MDLSGDPAVFYTYFLFQKALLGVSLQPIPKHFILAVFFIYWLAYKLLGEKMKFTISEEAIVEKFEPMQHELATKEKTQSKYLKTGLDAEKASQIRKSYRS